MVDTIVLAGAASHLQGLVSFMQTLFTQRIEPATLGDDFAFPILCAGSELPPRGGAVFALAAGLAVKEPMDYARAAQAKALRAKRSAEGGVRAAAGAR
jgi:hypothetical protein